MRTILPVVLLASSAWAGPFEAGVSRLDITPQEPVRLAGYAARQHRSTGVAQKLWAKALALRDARGHRVVVVTMDLLRVPRSISDVVADEARKRYGLQRSELLMNCSHNHSGPLLWEGDAFPAVNSEDYEISRRYTVRITEELVTLVGAALKDLSPATLSFGFGEASFAANRRVRTETGYQIAYNPDGPADHRVPVLRIGGPNGAIRAVLFGYACHNTTIGPSVYDVNADYAGFAQAALEQAHPTAVALFLQLCAGDQDPHPRGGLDVAERHGKELASAVEAVLAGRMKALRGPVGTAFRNVDLAFEPHTREMFEKRLTETNAALVRNARTILRSYDEGHPPVSLPYPVQAVSLGRDLSIVAIGGEPVIDYALRAQKQFPGVILAGYSNSVRGYIPSRRVLSEGGYEAGESAIYYGLPGPFTSAVEDTIFETIGAVLRDARGK